MREAQEHEAFDRHLASLPKLLCGCSVGTGCDGAHARRPAKHGDSAKLSVADAHQLRILKDTVRNPLKGQFLGGPSAEEAEETLRSKFRFTSEQIRNLKGGARHGDMCDTARRPTTKQKLEAIKHGRELPVDPRAMGVVGEVPATDERAVHILAREYQRAKDPDYVSISWACQVKAADYFNAHGLAATLKEILRVGGPDALS